MPIKYEHNKVIIVSDDGKEMEMFNDDGYIFRSNATSVRFSVNLPLDDIVDNINDELAVYRLAKKMYKKDTNMICYHKNHKVYPADVKQISEYIGRVEWRTKEFLKSMVEKGVIAKASIEVEAEKFTCYYINPMYFLNGTRIPHNLYILFRTQLDKRLPGYAIRYYNKQPGNTKIQYE